MRNFAKLTANLLARLLVSPLQLAYWSAALLVGKDRAFPGWSQLLSLLPGTTGTYLRRAFFAGVLPSVGKDSVVSFGTVFSHPTSTIGRNAYVGVYCCLGDVDLGDDVLVGSHVSIMNGSKQHGINRLDVLVREQPGVWPRVSIGDDTWIGDRAIVMADVGDHCVVGAGAIVTKAVPDYAIVAGAPARIIGDRRELLPAASDTERAFPAASRVSTTANVSDQIRIAVPGE